MMKKKRNYIPPRTDTVSVSSQGVICTSMQWTDDSANKDYEVLSRKQRRWEFDEEDDDWEDW